MKKKVWLLTFSFIGLITLSVVVFMYSNYGQALYLEKKLKWYILPKLINNPGGIDSYALYVHLNPQWDNLIANEYVSYYIRDFQNITSDNIDQKALDAVWDDVVLKDLIPKPFETVSGVEFRYDLEDKEDESQYMRIIVLINKRHHEYLDALLDKHLGTHGTKGDFEKITFFSFVNYMPHVTTNPDGTRSARPRF